MRIAVVGCCHGELNLMYQKVLEAAGQESIDLVLVTGDFQAIRSASDLTSMSVPQKYLRFGDFRDYFECRRQAPIPTIFIGGNHESSNYMRQLYYGGWVCPNIYYLGSAGVIRFGGLRIAGISGIYAEHDYKKPYFERIPLTDFREKKSVYHYRELDIWRLGLLKEPVDIMMSHDWPKDIWEFGDKQGFLSRKPFLKKEIENGSFGSLPLCSLMNSMSPRFWFSAHMHCKFQAQRGSTFFLALDKCVRGREFIDVFNISVLNKKKPYKLHYDNEWLMILKATQDLIKYSFSESITYPDSNSFAITNNGQEDQEIEYLDKVSGEDSTLVHYENFLEKSELSNPFTMNK